MVRDVRDQQLRDTVTTTYSVTPAVRHDAYHATADAAATSSRLAVRTVRVIIGEKFLDGGRNSKRVPLRYDLRVRLCSTVFIFNYFFLFYVGSCGRLSWLNCQLSSAR